VAEKLRKKLQQLRRKYKTDLAAKKDEDPLLHKLTCYHARLSQQVDNLVSEKVSAEIESVVDDISKIDEVDRPFKWSTADQDRLNGLNAQVSLYEVLQCISTV
jgi:hypothetical protein